MAIRRVNHTGRMRILRQDVRIFVKPDADGYYVFDALIDLRRYRLPEDAHVYVEAYRQTTLMRFDYGIVARPQPSSGVSGRLTEFPTTDGLRFRVKVTSEGDRPGMLLAEADPIPTSDQMGQPDKRVSLLPAEPADLGNELWRVDFSDDGPHLKVNCRLRDWKATASSAIFRALVFPAAMRHVLNYVHYAENMDDDDDDSDWRCRWIKFAKNLPGVPDPPSRTDDNDVWDQWIDSAVDAFSRLHNFLDHFKSAIPDEQVP